MSTDIFGPDVREESTYQPLLTAEVAALCASLGITTESGAKSPYKPDAFVQAVRQQHAKLLDIKARLTRQNEEQAEREAKLQQRESVITFREQRVAAHEQLLGLEQPKKWWRVFS